MACWSASVDAAEARKAELSSIIAILKPIPYSSPEVLPGAIGYRQSPHLVLMINQLWKCSQILQVMDDSGSRRF